MMKVQPDLLSIDRNEIKKYTLLFHVTCVSSVRKKNFNSNLFNSSAKISNNEHSNEIYLTLKGNLFDPQMI